MSAVKLTSAEVDAVMVKESEAYVEGRTPVLVVQEPGVIGGASKGFYDAAQLRAAFRHGYDYANREAATLIEAQAARIAELEGDKREALMQAIASDGQAQEAHEAYIAVDQERKQMALDWSEFCEAIGVDLDTHEVVADTVNSIKAALKPFADEAEYYEPDEGDGGNEAWRHKFRVGQLRTAARSLNGGE